jgi:hypothetical protein
MSRYASALAEAVPELEKWLQVTEKKKTEELSQAKGTFFFLLANYWSQKALLWSDYMNINAAIIKGDRENAEKYYKKALTDIVAAKAKISNADKRISMRKLKLAPKIYYYSPKGEKQRLPAQQFFKLSIDDLCVVIEQLNKKIENVSNGSLLSPAEEQKIRKRVINAGQISNSVPVWDSITKTDTFIVYNTQPQLKAFFDTSCQFSYNASTLYIKCTMKDSKNRKVVTGRMAGDTPNFWTKRCEENDIELFISPPGDYYYQFASDPLGRVMSIKCPKKPGVEKSNLQNSCTVKTTVDKGKWEAVFAIPFSTFDALPGKNWTISISRQHVNENGEIELSSSSFNGGFHQWKTYDQLRFDKKKK